MPHRRRPLPLRPWPRVLAAALGCAVGAVVIGCARPPVTTTAVGTAAEGPTGNPVTTRAGTTTTEAPPTTVAPVGTTAGTTPIDELRVVSVTADTTVDLAVGQRLELVLDDDPTGEFLWKADQKGTSVTPAGVRTEAPTEGRDRGTIVTAYVGAESGETVVTFSAAKADGTPGDQFRVTIVVA